VHYAHAMGVDLAGGTPVGVRLACGTFSTQHEFGHLPLVDAAPNLDAMAVLAKDENSLILMLLHRSAHAGPIQLTVDLGGFPAQSQAGVVTLAQESLDDENTLEQPERVAPRPSAADIESGTLTLTLPPYSLTRVDIPRAAASS
jgi:alpha-N-arabinofuranosidase